MRWYIKSISSCRLLLWKTKDVSKETCLVFSYIIHKRLSVGGVNSIVVVGYAIFSFYPKHDPVVGGGKNIGQHALAHLLDNTLF